MKADTPLVGQVVGSYEILRELGRGGMGVVYKAHETSLNRMVALKVLPAYLATDQAFLSRFVREARAAASLIHPNVVTIHAVGEDRGTHFIAMEYVKGQTVSQLIRQSGTIHPERALQIILEAADALSEAHKRGIVHRDIKPQNIMIDEAGRVKVMDFGLAKAVTSESNLTADGAMIGTPMYMSPEQCEGKKADPRSDIYALGVVLYEMLSGRTPYEAATPLAVMRQIVDRPFPDIQQVSPVVSAEVAQILRRMVAKDIAERYQSIDQIRADIRAVIGKAGAAAAIYTDRTVPVEMAETYAPNRNISQVDTVMPPVQPTRPGAAPAPMTAPVAPAGNKSSALIGVVAAVVTAVVMFGGFLLFQNSGSTPDPGAPVAVANPPAPVDTGAAASPPQTVPTQAEIDQSNAEAASLAAQAEEARKRAEEQALMLAAAEEAARASEQQDVTATALEELERQKADAEAALAMLMEERAAREELELEAARLKAAEQEARTKAEELERQKLEAERMAAAEGAGDEEAARKAAEAEAARRAAAARKAAEEKAAREEALRIEAEQAEAARLAAEEAAKPKFPIIDGAWSASGNQPVAEGRGPSIASSASVSVNGTSATIQIDGKQLTGQYVGGRLTGKYETTISATGRSGKGKTQIPQIWEISLLAVSENRMEGTFSVTHSGFQASEAAKNGTRNQAVTLTR